LMHGAIRGMVQELDEYSQFFTPQELEDVYDTTEGEYSGVGLEVTYADNRHLVVEVMSDSPAENAGIEAGDTILLVDGTPAGPTHRALRDRLRGPAGSRVVLTIQREDREEPWEYTLVRGWVRIPALRSELLSPTILYVKLDRFSRGAHRDIERLWRAQTKVSGVIIDLRGNPGGLYDEATAIADFFLEDGTIVTATGRNGKILEESIATKRGDEPDCDMAVLIDQQSASAAEILAAALKDHGRAKLFGQRTFGKGSVQNIINLSDGGGLKLTIARYLTPNGHFIEGRGIEPHRHLVEAPRSDRLLDEAVSWLNDGGPMP
ncbi:MAG: S41 family peptidase, partial [Myxococcota bacterium]|nr:S41 family peptidase [Myxococcota bacterium]